MQGPVWDRAVETLRIATPVEERWIHLWGVVETSMQLALCHGVSIQDAAWAALLHDCAKCMKKDDMRAIMEQNSLATEEDDWRHPAVWHSLVGAYLAASQYGIDKPAVLRAIRLHPTGDADMGPLELLLFVADYVEPAREYDAARELRRKAFDLPLECSAFEVCRNKIDHLRSKGREMHARSFRTFEDLKRRAKVLH